MAKIPDLSRFPFHRDALRPLAGADVNGLFCGTVMERAMQQIRMAAENQRCARGLRPMVTIGEDSYSAALAMFVAGAMVLKDARIPWLTGKWILAEATVAESRVNHSMRHEKDFGIGLLHDVFGMTVIHTAKDYRLTAGDYLSLSCGISGNTWSLVNQDVSGGTVAVTLKTVCRLVRERASMMIRELLNGMAVPDVTAIHEAAASLRDEYRNMAGPTASTGRTPPCMADAILVMQRGENLSHNGRFMLGTFMINGKSDINGIVGLYRGAPDFDERVTRYQLSNIQKNGYACPACATLEGQDLCRRTQECGDIRTPMRYAGRDYLPDTQDGAEAGHGKPAGAEPQAGA